MHAMFRNPTLTLVLVLSHFNLTDIYYNSVCVKITPPICYFSVSLAVMMSELINL